MFTNSVMVKIILILKTNLLTDFWTRKVFLVNCIANCRKEELWKLILRAKLFPVTSNCLR